MNQAQPRIVVGVDGSELAAKALEWAVDQASLINAILEVVVVWHYPALYGAAPVVTDWDPEADARTVGEEAVAVARGRRPEVGCRLTVTYGGPAEILTEACKGAVLLVVGARGHNAVSRVFLGSTSSQVLSHAECSVIAVR